MKGNFDIIWYLIPLAIGLLKFVFKDKGKTSKNTPPKPTEVLLPQQEVILEQEAVPNMSKKEAHFEDKLRDFAREEELENRKISEHRKTFLDRDPYKESIEYRKRKVKKRVEQKTKQTTEGGSQDYFSDIDWKKAVVFSEILKPRF